MSSKVNLIIEQGTTFNTIVLLNDQNGNPLATTGYGCQAQLRKHYQSSNGVQFTTNISNGQLLLSLTATQTANIVGGRYVYDVDLSDQSNNIIRLIEGIITVTPMVTRWQSQ